MEDLVDTETSASVWVWLGLSFIAIVSFYLQSTVTEERFVPALNVVADHFNIPDDVAGATLMAAGASSPELFSSIVALFITHSALGLGTVVGSEIFNQLIICAGAVIAAQNGRLHLDKAILIREVGFYALSVILLYLALTDHRPDPDDPNGPEHIYISFYDALLLFGAYIAYVLVCSYFDNVVAFLTTGKIQGSAVKEDYGTFSKQKSKETDIAVPENMLFLTETKYEPKTNFPNLSESMKERDSSDRLVPPVASSGDTPKTENGKENLTLSMTVSGGATKRDDSNNDSIRENISVSNRLSSRFAESIRSFMGKFSDGASTRAFQFLVHEEKPSDQHDLYDVEMNEFNEIFSCFLWQRSLFYSKSKVALNGWHLRWFSFTHDKVVSVPDRKQYERHTLRYPRFEQIEVDNTRLMVKLITPNRKWRNYVLMAPSKRIFKDVVSKCEELMEYWENEKAEAADEAVDSGHADDAISPAEIEDGAEPSHDADEHPSLIEFPAGESILTVIIYLILFPFNLLMHLTIPDVRHISADGDPKSNVVSMAFVAVVMCLVWLIVGSYAMVSSLENLADLMDIPDAVIGITVSAVGTSLPNYVASKCAAQQGFGNMAVSNAFGSNTFNILVGLGLPWLLYTAFGTHGKPYHGLRNEGILDSVIVMITVLVIFVFLMVASSAVMYRWHAFVFIGLYLMFLFYAVDLDNDILTTLSVYCRLNVFYQPFGVDENRLSLWEDVCVELQELMK